MSIRVTHIPSNRADSGDQSDPIGKQDENENSREIPKRPLHQMWTDDALQKVRKTSHHPLPEILRPVWNPPHVSRGDLRENNQAQRDCPRNDHRIGNRKAERPRYFNCLVWKTMLFFVPGGGFVGADGSLRGLR